MTSILLTQLLQFYQEEPDDPFNIYALAIEYLKTDQIESQRLFDILLQKHSNYLPTYYQAAAFFYEIGEIDKSILFYKKGIELAKNSGQDKVKIELSNAYRNMLEEQEE